MRNIVLMAGLGLALAGCKSEPSVSLTNASPEEVAKQASAAGVVSQIRPGQWETRVELVEFDMPGMAPEMKAEAMKKSREASAHSYCVSEADAKKPGGLFTGKDDGKCTYSKFEMSGGKLDMTLSCPGRTGGMTMHVAGTFDAEAVTATSEMETSGAFAMKMKANVHSRRTGACTDKKAG